MSGKPALAGNFIATHHSATYDYIAPLKLNLAGKHVLITGGAWESGVRYAAATGAATQAGRPEPMVLGFVVHISNQASVQALHDNVEQYFSRCLVILVNNIGDMELLKPFLDLDADICYLKLAILRWTKLLQTTMSKGLLPKAVRNAFLESPDIVGDTIAWLDVKWRELMARKDEIVVGDKLKLRMASRVSDLPD
ncbi:hypothetical protein BJX68DRAFT_275920 [Aspergillus pseudodeflectus]|uniref:Uncharacterized protein n=1 Tax=Aspergillus pseudodeflectus TaxID=176178 RepID=A0ABR4KEJ1_9EURO